MSTIPHRTALAYPGFCELRHLTYLGMRGQAEKNCR
jgi:hypothetical protein